MDPLTELKARISEAVSAALSQQGVELGPESVEVNDRGQGQKPFGDLSTASAIKGAASSGRNPSELAESIASSIDRIEMIDRVEALRGYLNFHIDWDAFAPKVIGEVLGSGKQFGGSEKRLGTLVLEHTSVNPTGPINIARSRNSILGDSLSRIYAHMGWKLSRHYLLNDIGHQIVMIHWGREKGFSSRKLQERHSKYAHKKDFQILFTYVATAEKARKDAQAQEEIARLESKTHQDAALLDGLREQSRACLDGQLETLSRLGIEFDEVMPESAFIGKLPEVLERLRDKGVVVDEPDGSKGLDLSSLGLARRKTGHITIVKADGSSTYTLRDIAYHEWKFLEGDRFITVLGEDHKREFRELKAALDILGHRKDLRAAFYSFVTYEGGKKMSTRGGTTVPLDEIIDEAVLRAKEEVIQRRGELPEDRLNTIANQVGLGAIKFNILKVDPSKGIQFRWEEAINFSGDSAAYVQYACARASSILRNAGEYGPAGLESLSSGEERDLILSLSRSPQAIARSAEEMKPNYIAEHAIEVATCFNKFYMEHRVLQAEDPLRSARLCLVEATRIVLDIVLGMLGVAAPQEI